MAYAIDYSFARPDPKAIKAAGYSGVFRYVSRPTNNGKNISAGEMQRLRAAGLDVTLNFEQYERRPLEGVAAGQQDAHDADALADAVGYPRECAIYYSVDFGTDWPSVRAYFQGVKQASKRPVGLYGGIPLILAAQDEGLVRFGWATNAASWSGKSAWGAVLAWAQALGGRVHVVQHLHSNTPAPVSGVGNDTFDPNTILVSEYGQWHAGDTDMPLSQADLEAINTVVGNRVVGDLQTTLREAITPAIVTGVVNAIKPLLKASGVTVDTAAIAKAAADEVAKRLGNG